MIFFFLIPRISHGQDAVSGGQDFSSHLGSFILKGRCYRRLEVEYAHGKVHSAFKMWGAISPNRRQEAAHHSGYQVFEDSNLFPVYNSGQNPLI